MPKRRLQCGSCGTIIKVSSRVFRPVCPQCQTAHTFIRCGRVECGTLMCLPENVNQFSCPRCNVQLARPGHSQARSGPMAVRCGNTACDFLMTIPGNVGRFRCPRCSMEQVLPGTEEALKCRARQEEALRQKEIRSRETKELAELCKLFGIVDSAVVEAVYESCDKQRTATISRLLEMVEDTGAIEDDLREEVIRLQDQIVKVRALVEQSIRCPISGNVMEDPVFAADGFSYEHSAIAKWLKTSNLSPVTKEVLSHKNLIKNHQLRGQIQGWKEQAEAAQGGSGPPVMEALSCATGSISPLEYTMDTDEDTEAGAPLRTSDHEEKGGFVSQMLRSINSLSGSAKRSGEA
ncbi:hypothetical protein GUITHDRAFT_163902 [Guillardia theta CCMP2712]|uniref:U-box domain-containing protein n=1 Tax=Guillardia theta (strain CCMP2712) TaxID=905079 RepID=L1J5H6_GUITC|nr:hypothetical protein GUITHDRAFT_163902 [Guillardia theta CCMP2712]EKX43325.1 hypothetical protein GUITHDRAFT_163902 [Guillardia theta CCMP2712]|eukprot:XP_005830305.1 hypothetical protein GUITHDRAFT_163902 [Guillardia theta CCMP2712]